MESLERFITAQNGVYENARQEIKNGRKTSHWMWFIFPQLMGLGNSETARFYALKDLKEAEDYLKHPILGKRLIDISAELLKLRNKSADAIFGYPDYLKLHSSMTLFSMLATTNDVFKQVLETYYDGIPDKRTTEIVNNKFG